MKSDITSIYKKKGSRLDMDNDRGIFGLSIFKKIIDKLIYIEKYPLLDANMTDSNPSRYSSAYSFESDHRKMDDLVYTEL